MAEELLDLIRQSGPCFQPHAVYIESADCLQVYIEEGATVRRRVDDIMTFYEDPESGSLTGCMVKGVRRLSEALGTFGINVCEGNSVRISMVFWAYTVVKGAPLEGWPPAVREAFAKLVKKSDDMVAEKAAA